MAAEPTVLQVLTAPNPKLDLKRQPQGGDNTNNPEFIYVDIKHVSIWEDFNIDTITAAYSDILNSPYGRLLEHPVLKEYLSDSTKLSTKIHDPDELTRSVCEITLEKNVDSVCERWCTVVIRSSMKAGAAIIRSRLGLTAAEPSFLHTGDSLTSAGGTSFQPDWYICDHVPDEEEDESDRKKSKAKRQSREIVKFVMGESKLSGKWRSSWLSIPDASIQASEAKERMWPIRQIASYCRSAKTRYGFLITGEELVAVRVHEIPGGYGRAGVAASGVAYRAVPWESAGPQDLTVNLAIWTLVMMSMNDQFREYATEEHYKTASLGMWRRILKPVGSGSITKTDRGKSYLVHSLSGLEEDEEVVRAKLQQQLVIVEPGQDILIEIPPKRRQSKRVSSKADEENPAKRRQSKQPK